MEGKGKFLQIGCNILPRTRYITVMAIRLTRYRDMRRGAWQTKQTPNL